MGSERTAWERVQRLLRRPWRWWLRFFHRHAGYLAIGLTFVYAISGIAINHINSGDGGWDPNFVHVENRYELGPLPDDEWQATKIVLDKLGIDEKPRDFYLIDTQLEIELPESSHRISADITTGTVNEEKQKDRFFLRVANWLHYNRGKAAWTYIADAYAFFLLFLAISGAFMIKGRQGLIGWGGLMIVLGASIPILYVQLSGGP